MADEMACMDDFRSSLADLKVNSKPLIGMLTMLADDYKIYAEKIVKIIEIRLHEAPSTAKLPCLYLIDSIIKNVDKSRKDENSIPVYQELFGKKIVSNFCHVFESANDATREKMLRLRKTWKNLFDYLTLQALDARVLRVKPTWQITAEPPPTDTLLTSTGTIKEANSMCPLKMQQERINGQREKREHSPSTDMATMRNQRRKLSDGTDNGSIDETVDDDDQEEEMRNVIQMSKPKRQEPEVLKPQVVQPKLIQRQHIQQLERLEKEKREKEMKEQLGKSLQIEREFRQQTEIMQRVATSGQLSVSEVEVTVGASAIAAPSSRDPRSQDSYEITTNQLAIVRPTVVRPLASTSHAEPVVPVDELGRLTRGISRSEAVQGIGYSQGPTLVNSGLPIQSPLFPGFESQGSWGVHNTDSPSTAFGGSLPLRPEFNSGWPMETDDGFHHTPFVMMSSTMFNPGAYVMMSPSMFYPPPMLQYPPSSAPTVWNNIVQPQLTQSSLPVSTVSTAAVVATPAPSTSNEDVTTLLTRLIQAGAIRTNRDTGATTSVPTTGVETISTAATTCVPTTGVETISTAATTQTESKIEQAPVSCAAQPPIVPDDLSRAFMHLAGQSSAVECVLEQVPDLTELDRPSLRVRYSGVIGSLHQGVHCAKCGMRFKSDELETAYKEHLDWHFRKNKRLKAGDATSRTRGWYYEAIDWIEYKEMTAEEECEAVAAALLEEGHIVEALNNPVPLGSMSCAYFDERPTASRGTQLDNCPVCLEAFVCFWDKETNEWRLKDAVRFCGSAEGKEDEKGLLVGRAYHPICLEDAPLQDF